MATKCKIQRITVSYFAYRFQLFPVYCFIDLFFRNERKVDFKQSPVHKHNKNVLGLRNDVMGCGLRLHSQIFFKLGKLHGDF